MRDGEPKIRDRIDDPPGFSADQLHEVRARDLAVRFAAGALTSVCAGIVTLVWGPKVGGVLLAFPAILAASLTLIEQEDDPVEAREDARGAVIGGLAMVAFAGSGALWFTRASPAIVLLVAAAAWVVIAVGGYFIAWFGPRRR